MGLSRLDELSLWTQYSRTAGDTASSSSLASPRLFELFQVIAFCLYITWALSLAILVTTDTVQTYDVVSGRRFGRCVFLPVRRVVGGAATSFTIFMKYDVDIRK